jgi:phosphate transport system substrate-binding protein
VEPSLESVTAAAGSARFAPDTDFRVSITNAPGANSYPISSFTWLLVRRDTRDPARARQLRDFLTWMISPEAQQIAKELHYSPLPLEVVTLIRSRIAGLRAAGRAMAQQ